MAWVVRRDLKTGPRYYVRYSLNGKKGWFSAGKSRATAERVRAKIETEIIEGRFLDRRRLSDWTLGELQRLYLDRLEPLKPRSAKWRRGRLAEVVRRLGPETPIEHISLETIDRYVHARMAAGLAVSTINGEVAVLRHALSSALRWQRETGLSEYRLASWRPVRGEPKRKPVFLSREQVRALLRAGKARGGHAYLFLRVFLATGARPGEILRLQPEDLRKEAIWFETLKDGSDRLAAIPRSLEKELRAELPFEGSGQAKNRYRRFWRAVRVEAGIGEVRLYDLRHTAISAMLARGTPPRVVQRTVGHKSYRTTEGYAHFAKDAKPARALRW